MGPGEKGGAPLTPGFEGQGESSKGGPSISDDCKAVQAARKFAIKGKGRVAPIGPETTRRPHLRTVQLNQWLSWSGREIGL